MNKSEIKREKENLNKSIETVMEVWKREYLSEWVAPQREAANASENPQEAHQKLSEQDNKNGLGDIYYTHPYGNHIKGLIKKLSKLSAPPVLVDATKELIEKLSELEIEHQILSSLVPDKKPEKMVYNGKQVDSKELFNFLKSLKNEKFQYQEGLVVGCFIGRGVKLHHGKMGIITHGEHKGKMGVATYKRNWNWGEVMVICPWDLVPESLKAYNQE